MIRLGYDKNSIHNFILRIKTDKIFDLYTKEYLLKRVMFYYSSEELAYLMSCKTEMETTQNPEEKEFWEIEYRNELQRLNTPYEYDYKYELNRANELKCMVLEVLKTIDDSEYNDHVITSFNKLYYILSDYYQEKEQTKLLELEKSIEKLIQINENYEEEKQKAEALYKKLLLSTKYDYMYLSKKEEKENNNE